MSLAATHGLNNFRPNNITGYFTNFLNGLTASLRTYETSEKHKNTTFFSRITCFLEPVSAETRVQAWPKSQRQRSWQPESSISDVEAVCSGQVNSLRNREFQGEMKVQKHLEIDVSAGLSLGRHTRPQQFPVENFTTVLHQLSERSDSKSPHLRALNKNSIEL